MLCNRRNYWEDKSNHEDWACCGGARYVGTGRPPDDMQACDSHLRNARQGPGWEIGFDSASWFTFGVLGAIIQLLAPSEGSLWEQGKCNIALGARIKFTDEFQNKLVLSSVI